MPACFASLRLSPLLFGRSLHESGVFCFTSGHVMSLIVRIASRNLLQDRVRFVITVVGIVISIVLVTVQMGLFLSFERMVSTMIDHAPGGLWIVPTGTKCFEDSASLDTRDRAAALAVPGVTAVVPVVIGFAEWTVPSGGTTPVFVIGSGAGRAGLHAWNLVAGNARDLARPHAVAVDRTYFARLGIGGIGATTKIRGRAAQVVSVTDGIRSFTTTPYVFATLDRARSYIGMPKSKVSYFLVHLAKGADIGAVREHLAASLQGVEVLTPAAFRRRARDFWLFGTGAGAALFAGALLGAIVGTVIVAQTLYSSTKDHLTEFAILRAIGSSGLYIHKVIICQALLSAAISFSLASGIGLLIVMLTAGTALPIVMTPALTAGLFGLTILMCIASAIAAIVEVTRMDPARILLR